VHLNDREPPTTTTDPDRIAEAIIERNLRHFSQATGTPFTKHPMIDLFGPDGTNNNSDQLLSSTLDCSTFELTPALRTVLHKLSNLPTLPHIDHQITSHDVREGYKAWNEQTTTSPSGLHLGHFKAILKWDNSEHSTATNTLADRLFQIHATFLQAAIEHNIVYQRWTKVTMVMIEKQSGNPTINKLRALHIFENDFNLLLGVLWGKRLQQHG